MITSFWPRWHRTAPCRALGYQPRQTPAGIRGPGRRFRRCWRRIPAGRQPRKACPTTGNRSPPGWVQTSPPASPAAPLWVAEPAPNSRRAPNDLAGCPVLLVNPRLPLSTGPVFKAWDGVDRGPDAARQRARDCACDGPQRSGGACDQRSAPSSLTCAGRAARHRAVAGTHVGFGRNLLCAV